MTDQNSKSPLPAQADHLPDLPFDQWQETANTLHMWAQIVGKIRLATSPMMNHWWQSTLYLTARGLTTSTVSFEDHIFQIDFDFLEHVARVQSSRGAARFFPLAGHSVASFYHDLMETLHSLGIEVKIWTVPVEVEEQIPFEQDDRHAAYDPEYASRFWRVLLQVERVIKVFRGRFRGKASPIHFFWGSFDLAVTRFSGRTAPTIQGAYHVAKYVMQEAYSNEVSSCGFWPGAGLGEAAFYAYAYPEPPGFLGYPVQPAEAYYHPTLKEFILPYEAVRSSQNWEQALLSFLQSTYEAAANLAKWDRDSLESSFLIPPDKTT